MNNCFRHLGSLHGYKNRYRLLTGISRVTYNHASRILWPWESVNTRNIHSPYTPLPSAVGFTDYEDEKLKFQIEVPDYYNFATDIIDTWAQYERTYVARKNTPAFWWVDDKDNELQWSFLQVSQNSKRTANVLAGPCGLGVGDSLLCILPRVPQWWLLNVAAIRTGSILIPGTPQLTAKDIMLRLQRSKAKCVVCNEDTAEKVDQVIRECPTVQTKLLVSETDSSRTGWLNFTELYNQVSAHHVAVKSKAGDPMTRFFTSGTTAEPKMVEHTHISYGLASKITGKFWLDLVPDDIHWNLSDTGWAKAAWSNLFAPWIQGACVFVHHTAGFDPPRVLQMLDKYPINTFCTAPTAYRMMIQEPLHKYDLRSVRHTVSAGEPLNPEVTDTWFDGTKLQIREGYGQTESVLQCASFRCIPNKPGSMGKSAPGMNIQVIDNDGNEMSAGEEGEVAIKVKPSRPIGLFTSYVDDEERTVKSFRGDYYTTGDRAYKDEDGYFWFVGRTDDIITSAGYRISPFEVESILQEHPAVAESAVVASPDSVRGAIVKAFVVLSQSRKPDELEHLAIDLQEHVKASTAPYKYPRKIEFTDVLPKTFSGKIRRVELRNKEYEKK